MYISRASNVPGKSFKNCNNSAITAMLNPLRIHINEKE
jgi:hypothetical protein